MMSYGLMEQIICLLYMVYGLFLTMVSFTSHHVQNCRNFHPHFRELKESARGIPRCH